MQDQTEIVAVNELRPHPVIVQSIAAALERAIKARLARGDYIIANGMVRKRPGD